ncbi:MAG: CsgG/HfaB family protein [Betaproteobacteria bacterium]|nr:CsgG/HfaB family protein [Betaproteobacteria bacterium]
MRYLHFFCVLAIATTVALVGCGKQETPSASTTTNAAPPVPDVGKVVNEKTTAQGFGATAGEAVSDAMKMAILQVNGAAVQASTVTAKYGLDVSIGRDTASLRANEFAEVVKQRSGGVIQNFRVTDLQEPSVFGGKRYKATIEAQIAKFNPSTDMQKIKVIVGPIHFDSASLPMGDRSVSAAEVETTLRQRISDALVQTGRFAILDREFSPEIERELDMISSGQAPSAELAKLSQAASADLVWSAHVSNFAYNRYARQLKTSDRQLVSYSGGWAISEKLVNVATRQVVASDSLRGQAPSIAPTTLSQGVDSSMILEGMNTDIVNQVVASVLRRTFPVTVVALDGSNAVLSQGGQALKEGARYAMVTMGAEMKDPQTGQSLGRVETPCCELVVERVTPNLSYGRLENIRSNLEQLPTGGLQLREQLAETSSVVKASTSGDNVVSEDADASTPKAAPPKKSSKAQQHPAAASKDDDNW